jgi:enoyl-CoA hydratase/carnithine racemase
VVCAHGAAIAGGCALLGGGDVVVTNRDAKLGYPVVRLGVSPAVTSPFLRQSLGMGGARRRLLDPALFSGEEAFREGLAGECLETADSARARAEEVAQELARKPRHAVHVTKQWINELDGSRDEGVISAALEASTALAGGEEEQERLAALWKKD